MCPAFAFHSPYGTISPEHYGWTSVSVWLVTSTTPYMVYANCAANSPCPLTTQRCRPRRPQRCRHGTRSCAHELYGLTPRTVSLANK